MRVRDIMERDVVTLESAYTLDVATDIMRLRRVRHLPVLSGVHLIGIVSQRDLFRSAIGSLLEPSTASDRECLPTLSIRHVMTRDVVTIEPDAPVLEAMRLMVEKRIGCLPVVHHDTLVGIVSEADCLRYLTGALKVADAEGVPPKGSHG